MRALLDDWFDYVRENQHAWVMLFRDRSGDDEIQALRAAGEPARARGHRRVHRGARRGSGSPPQVEPTAEALTSGLAGLALWWIDNPEVPKEVPVDVGTRVVTAAL